MKTRTWILILGGLFAVLAALAAFLHLTAAPAARAEVWVDGVLQRSVDLSQDETFRIETERGWNEIEVSEGAIRVVQASCPGGDCIRCGRKNSGAPIVCLPNRVSICFTDGQGLDGIAR